VNICSDCRRNKPCHPETRTAHVTCIHHQTVLTSRARGNTIYMPPPLCSPRGGAPAPRAPPSRRNVAVVSHAQHVLTPTCLTCQHGGEQSGLVTLTFDFLTLKVVSDSRVTWATSLPILVFLGLSVLDLDPMYRQTSSDSIIA